MLLGSAGGRVGYHYGLSHGHFFNLAQQGVTRPSFWLQCTADPGADLGRWRPGRPETRLTADAGAGKALQEVNGG